MIARLNHDPVMEIVTVELEGDVSLDTLKGALQKLITDDSFPPNTDTIWDLRKSNLTSVDKKLIDGLIKFRAEGVHARRGDAKVAIVADSDLSFGLSRMYQVLSEDLLMDVEIFREYQAAVQWLKSARSEQSQ